MAIRTVLEFLRSRNIPFTTINHSPAYTAQEVAEAAHIHGQNLAKVVIVSADGQLAMVVLPAHYHVALDNLRDAIGAKEIHLASEAEFAERFPGCELGAIPPFGNLFGMDVFMDTVFTADEDIAFSAGSHSELIRMKFSDFAGLVNPIGITSGVSPAGMSPPISIREHKRFRI